jgi:hypothetical protein
MPRFYNLIGTLSWVATRDVEAADDLNRLWDEATNDLDRMVAAVYLTQYVMAARDIDQGAVVPLDTAKAEVIAACISEKLEAVGHSRGNEDTRPVPPTSWIGVKIDDAESSIGKERAYMAWSPVPCRRRSPFMERQSCNYASAAQKCHRPETQISKGD